MAEADSNSGASITQMPGQSDLIAAARVQADDATMASPHSPSPPGGVAPTSPRDVPSDLIPGFQIVRELGRGGQGIVFEAQQLSTRRRVAIKILHEWQHQSETARRRFEREIDLVVRLKHPGIISVFDSGTTKQGQPYFVMDYVQGVPLHRFVREERLTLEATLTLFVDVCEAVQYAHLQGVIHRDLKPSNVLVDHLGKPRIMDFGLAKSLAPSDADAVSMTESVFGTLPYMSPEQTRGRPNEIDARTDVYALGVILYELLTGHYPYPVVNNISEILRQFAETEPTPPSRRWARSVA